MILLDGCNHDLIFPILNHDLVSPLLALQGTACNDSCFRLTTAVGTCI
jgi:hypothetical protein